VRLRRLKRRRTAVLKRRFSEHGIAIRPRHWSGSSSHPYDHQELRSYERAAGLNRCRLVDIVLIDRKERDDAQKKVDGVSGSFCDQCWDCAREHTGKRSGMAERVLLFARVRVESDRRKLQAYSF
jgi:hypothetical protein